MSRTRLAAVAATMACAFMLGGAASASAQTDLTKRLEVSGSKKFTGTYTIDRFVRRGNKVFSVGTLRGKLRNDRRVKRENVRMPVSGFAASGPIGQSSQLVCRVLTLTLGPLDLNLLGLRVQLNRINLRITAIPGGGLLGDLLCGIANLLNPAAILGNELSAVLNSLLALVPTRPTG
ncbi:MAG TPA: hypothetical protein VNO82_01495 [Solirubrobacteraceae bacterium]|nr:hypothetical protein [Solirubrobacteraceae bacterium]